MIAASECRQSLMLDMAWGFVFFMFKCFVLATFTHFYDIISVSKTWW